MRNRIHASTINVIVDRQDRNDVAGIVVLREVRPSYCRASSASAQRAHASLPGCNHLGKRHVLGGKRLHQTGGQPAMAMQERTPPTWRSTRRELFTSRRLASIG